MTPDLELAVERLIAEADRRAAVARLAAIDALEADGVADADVAAAIVEMSAHYFVTRLQARPQILAALEAARQPLCCHCGRHPQTSVTPVADLVPGIH